MYKKLFLTQLCLFALCIKVLAQADSTTLLYEVSGNGLMKPSYVFGTIHLRDKRVFELNDSVWYCFNQSDVIAGELRFDKKELKESAAKEMMMPNGKTLSSLMSSEEYTKVKAFAKEVLGWKVFIIDRIKPLFTVSLLSEASVKSDKKYPLDIYLQQKGAKKKKEIVGIETVAEQMAAIDTISLKEQAQLLIDYVHNPSDENKNVERMIQLYQQGRVIDLYDMVYAELDDKTEAAMLTNRNRVMVNRMKTMMKAKSVFVAIGAAHLPGNLGVLHLLQEQGYHVRPVDNKSTKLVSK
jgi:uncharacterized protein